MERNQHCDSRYAAAFAILICAWAVLLVALGLAAPLRGDATAPAAAVVATGSQR